MLTVLLTIYNFSMKVRLGSSETSFDQMDYLYEEGIRDYGIQDFKIHQDYDVLKARFDLAIITLDEAIEWSGPIFPICLPTREDTELPLNHFAGDAVTVAGWGSTDPEDADSVSPELQQATIEIRHQE